MSKSGRSPEEIGQLIAKRPKGEVSLNKYKTVEVIANFLEVKKVIFFNLFYSQRKNFFKIRTLTNFTFYYGNLPFSSIIHK